MRRIRTVIVVASALAAVGLSGVATAREVADCQLWWGQAVRSYLTQKRTQGPEDEAYRPACELEAKGDKAGARLEAVVIGVRALAKLDARGCARFMERYIGADEPESICQAAATEDIESTRKRVQSSLPPAPAPKAKKP